MATEIEYKGKLVPECDGCKGFSRGEREPHNHCSLYPDSYIHNTMQANGHDGQTISVNKLTGKFWCYQGKGTEAL